VQEVIPAACVTVNVWFAIVTAPVRTAPGFGATVNETEPLPVPLPPAVTVIQETLVLANQAQLAAVETATVPLPPGAAIETSPERLRT
jgi:hypothetical protein